ncbi:uncharacterized protein LOC125383447 [Haliotis rufescens]|uniref:uncharacterized protein LOC125383447 n=1 Tax=Haliotis rufescens TaxID=6454 RepID=UPI00201F97DD|nr:uncharacterized protein LOC125383447 [Haliotis rufescens]
MDINDFFVQFIEHLITNVFFVKFIEYMDINFFFVQLNENMDIDFFIVQFIEHMDINFFIVQLNEHMDINFLIVKFIEHMDINFSIFQFIEHMDINFFIVQLNEHMDINFFIVECIQLKEYRGIISTLARRAKNISSTPQLPEAELNHLRTVFTSYNNYPVKLVNQTINRTLNTSDKPPRQQTAPFVISLPYIGTTSHQIRRLLEHEANIDVVFQRGQTIQNLLNATGKPPSTRKQDPAGVVCECGDSYVGETSRPLNQRLKEHHASVLKKEDSKSAISDHTQIHPSHNIKWDNVDILTTNQKVYKLRKFREDICIKRIQPAINRDQGYYIPPAYHDLISSPKQH